MKIPTKMGEIIAAGCSDYRIMVQVFRLKIKTAQFERDDAVGHAVQCMEDFIENEVRVRHIWKEYDCTGQWSTSHIDKLHSELISENDDEYLVYTIRHSMHCDI